LGRRYYALTERDDLGRYAAAREQTRRLFDETGTPEEPPESDVDLDEIESEVDELDDAAREQFDL